MDTKNPTHPILEEIAAFCEARGMAETTFGKKAMGDPSFVASLRRGRDLRWRTQCAVRQFMLTEKARPSRRMDSPRMAAE